MHFEMLKKKEAFGIGLYLGFHSVPLTGRWGLALLDWDVMTSFFFFFHVHKASIDSFFFFLIIMCILFIFLQM